MGRTTMGKHPLRYACPYCDKKYTSRSGLLSHKNTIHLRRKPYRCEYCNEHFFTSASRVAHIHRWHSGAPKSQNSAFGCSTCGQVFFSSPHLEEHMKMEHHISDPLGPFEFSREGNKNISLPFGRLTKNPNAKKESYTCLKCNQTFPQSEDLIRHLEDTHQPPKIGPFALHQVKEPIFSIETSTSHSDRLPPYSQPQKCCQRVFDEPLEFEIHKKYHHRNVHIPSSASLYCNLCTREFKDHESLSLHQSLYCGLSFLCNLCGKRYKNVGSYIKHVQIHHAGEEKADSNLESYPREQESPRLTCSKCGISFFDMRLYNYHIEQHETKPIQACVKCPFNTTSSEDLKNHYQENHVFKCDVCYKIFSSSKALSHHKGSSHLRSGLCPLCPTNCHTKDLLLTHLEEHHVKEVFENPRSCENCSFETLQVHSYIYHVKNGHNSL